MAATVIGDSTNAKTIISDNVVPGNGSYAWYIIDTQGNGLEPMAPIASADIAAGVNIKEKAYDTTAVYRISNEAITTSADWTDLRKALSVWDNGDTRLYMTVKNEWGVDLCLRGTDGVPATINSQYRGKLFNFRWSHRAAEVIVGIEFHYTSA